ncbi:UbiA family prenyltransferase [Candidatus Nitrosotenuis chungbukensis]|uniref:UbiA family prenyltransferase n=1 Tax=Candidatus Nitrosotenuis chungbukensis TaxID=1353246 RepID=UPI0005B255B7|nr:UbiA family prenyltransferase [Candidatus Nitrosotenuis chungbukensis]
MQKDRTSEWFVPKFGSKSFRISVGILFLPYTGMVVSFAAWGSFTTDFSTDRLVAICVLYFLALGVTAHCLDSIGSKTKPWGFLSKRKLVAISLLSLGGAFAIGLHYAFLDSPLLIPIGILESFFLFAYNLELFKGRFHNNLTFVVSWGILPVFAGSAIQSNSISFETVMMAGIAGALSYLLIITSRRYKELKRKSSDHSKVRRKEITLQLTSIGVIVITVCYLIVRHL